MEWYRVPIRCPSCGKKPHVVDVAINAQWELGVNFTCKCGKEGSEQFNVIELVQGAQHSDEVQFQ